MTKTKLKTFEHIFNGVDKSRRAEIAFTLDILSAIQDTFSAHHNYILNLEARIEELEKLHEGLLTIKKDK